MKRDRLIPPSPCKTCFNGPSSLCRRGIYKGGDAGGCKAWSEWFATHWPIVCEALARRSDPPGGESDGEEK